MVSPTSPAAEVLASEALENASTVVWQEDIHLGFRAVVKDVLLFLLDEVAGKAYAGMWSDHLEYLLEVEAAISAAQEVDDAVGRLERGFTALSSSVDRTALEVAKLPTAPPGGFALVLFAPLIKADPAASTEFNHTLDVWEEAARVATEHADEMVEVAHRFKNEAPRQIEALRQVVRDAPAGQVNDVLKNRYRLRLDLLTTELTRRVLPAVGKAERASEHARESWTKARDTQRFR